MVIDILCRVVDNYGDIGVAFRLARALSELDASLRLRLIVDDLDAFSKLEPRIDPSKNLQTVRGWTIVGWAGAPEPFRKERPGYVVECFACGRPPWFEEILFDPEDTGIKLIVNLEYLSAEDFSAEFHTMPSLTRSAFVKKAIFMPGFGSGTGGLILDNRFRTLRAAYRETERRPRLRRSLLRKIGEESAAGDYPADAPDRFWVSVFSYERDFSSILGALTDIHAEKPILAFAAAGLSAQPFLGAWQDAGKPFPVIALPFLRQETWDEVLSASDFSFVRGEDSLSRAALSGRPFLWQAYPLEDAHHLVKVRALVERMRPFFTPPEFAAIDRSFIAYNERSLPELELKSFLTSGVLTGFSAWSESLIGLGNLAEGLLTFMRDFG